MSQSDQLFESRKGFWKRNLRGITPLQLPIDNTRLTYKGHKYATLDVVIDGDIVNKIQTRLIKDSTTLHSILAATFQILLYRYCNQEEICARFNIVGIDYSEYNGLFQNSVVLQSELTGKSVFVNIEQAFRNAIAEASEHYVPVSKIRELLKDSKELSSNLDVSNKVVFFFDNKDILSQFTNTEGNLSGIVNDNLPGMELAYLLDDSGKGLAGKIIYDVALFSEHTIKSMVAHYQQLLLSLVDKPDCEIGSLPMLTENELNAILVTFNNTQIAYPEEKTLALLFEEQVARTPDNVALRQYDAEMSYAELNKKANVLANFLINQGVKNGDNIGLLVTRSFDMIIGMFAILKAGGAYVPIDPEYPIDRQEYILRNSSVSFVVTDTEYPLGSAVADVRFVNVNAVELGGYAGENIGLKTNSKQLAYTIYTSGSTGRPKGVMIEHHSAVNLILWVNNTFKVGSDDRLLFITSMCFDLSVYDIFGMLSSGGSIVIADKSEVLDVKKLPDIIEKYSVTFWDSVPTTMDYLIKGLESNKNNYQLESLRLVFMSGDWIPVNLPDRIKAYYPKAKVISLGGATEGTVWSNFYPIDKVEDTWKSIPYGRPMDNNTFYILNEQFMPVPFGVPGELFIGGVGVARGYANDKEKTDYSFIKDPFNEKLGGRMYRTGDLGRMMPDLNMEFIGRKDNQVKIRGFRVELGEIESVILQSGIIDRAVVIATKDKEGVNRLVGYVVPKKRFDRDALSAFLRSKLPDYMVPALWMELDGLPLTSNGKIDKKALPEVDATEQIRSEYAAPTNNAEINLVEIWQSVLGVNNIGIDDNFFDLGGQSLLAVEMTTEVENKFGKKVNIYTLFKYPTVRELATYLLKDNAKKAEKTYKSLVPIRTTGKKMPIYIVHGDGMNVVNFNNLGGCLDSDQPIYSLQPKGILEEDEPLDNMEEIAMQYIGEIMDQNPNGPYALAGYSFGGYVAIEMRNQLEKMVKEVKMVGIFDTDAQNTEYNRNWFAKLPQRIKRQFPKALFILKSVFQNPGQAISYQRIVISRRKNRMLVKLGVKEPPKLEGLDARIEKINQYHLRAYKNYRLVPFDGAVHLFKAKKRIYFVDDFDFLGWKKYALKGVQVFDVPGDHKTMFLPPNVSELGRSLQNALDNC